MGIGELIWAEDRVAHIAEHGIRPHEVEEICFGVRWFSAANQQERTQFTTFSGRQQAEALKRLAQSRGVGEADLIEEWVKEKLRAS